MIKTCKKYLAGCGSLARFWPVSGADEGAKQKEPIVSNKNLCIFSQDFLVRIKKTLEGMTLPATTDQIAIRMQLDKDCLGSLRDAIRSMPGYAISKGVGVYKTNETLPQEEPKILKGRARKVVEPVLTPVALQDAKSEERPLTQQFMTAVKSHLDVTFAKGISRMTVDQFCANVLGDTRAAVKAGVRKAVNTNSNTWGYRLRTGPGGGIVRVEGFRKRGRNVVRTWPVPVDVFERRAARTSENEK